MSDDVQDIAAELRRHLAWQESDGTRTLLGDRKAPAQAQPPAPLRAEPRAPAAPPAAPQGAVGGGTLDEVRRELGDCQRCKLCSGRTQLVFGAGNPRAELVFVGEGPGEQEDRQGLPFVGAAGQLLTKMIEAMHSPATPSTSATW